MKARYKKETVKLILSAAAVIIALVWKVPAKDTAMQEKKEQTVIRTKGREMPQNADPVVTEAAEKAISTQGETEPAKPEKIFLGEFTVTAYCPCEICCGEWANNRPGGIVYTANGDVAQEGITAGAAWDILPAGTHVEIGGLGERIIQDRPADWVVERYNGRIIDVYFESHQAAQDYGKQTVDVWIIEDAEGDEDDA